MRQKGIGLAYAAGVLCGHRSIVVYDYFVHTKYSKSTSDLVISKKKVLSKDYLSREICL